MYAFVQLYTSWLLRLHSSILAYMVTHSAAELGLTLTVQGVGPTTPVSLRTCLALGMTLANPVPWVYSSRHSLIEQPSEAHTAILPTWVV